MATTSGIVFEGIRYDSWSAIVQSLAKQRDDLLYYIRKIEEQHGIKQH